MRLIRFKRLDIQSMNPFSKLFGECLIDQPVPCYARKSCKNRAYDFYFDMRFALRIVSRMSTMSGGIVDDLHMDGRHRGLEFAPDTFHISGWIHGIPEDAEKANIYKPGS